MGCTDPKKEVTWLFLVKSVQNFNDKYSLQSQLPFSLQIFFQIWCCCFCSDPLDLMNMWRNTFPCCSNYNHKSQEPFLRWTLQNNGLCRRLGKPPTLWGDLAELYWRSRKDSVDRRTRGNSSGWVTALTVLFQGWKGGKGRRSTPSKAQSLGSCSLLTLPMHALKPALQQKSLCHDLFLMSYM
jgi:hypothetical protein